MGDTKSLDFRCYKGFEPQGQGFKRGAIRNLKNHEEGIRGLTGL